MSSRAPAVAARTDRTWLVVVAALILSSLVLLFPVTANAQLGGLVRKAKEKVVRDAGDKSGVNAALEGESVEFGAVILELTDERLAQVMRGMEVGRARVEAPNGRAAVVSQRDDLANQAADLSNKHGTEIDTHNTKRWEIERCRNEAFRERDQGRDEALANKAMTDLAFREKVMALAMRAAEVQASGDSVALVKLQGEMRALRGESRADTVAVTAKCGAAMAPHPVDAKLVTMRDEISRLDNQLRSMEESAAAEEVKASGLEPRQYHMARERIELYLGRAKNNAKQNGFTTNELKALTARRADLERLM